MKASLSAPLAQVIWSRTYRAISTRFPPIDLFERVARPEEFDELYALEAMTNPRIRQEVGRIALVPKDERVFGVGASWVMGAFTHISERKPSRFSDGTYGVYYAASEEITAIRETAHHLGDTYRDTNAEAGETSQVRMLVGRVDEMFRDIRGGRFGSLHDPDEYATSQAFGRRVRDAGENGVVYDSVRNMGGQCLAALRPKAVSIPIQGAHYEYHWNGAAFDKYWQVGRDDEWKTI